MVYFLGRISRATGDDSRGSALREGEVLGVEGDNDGAVVDEVLLELGISEFGVSPDPFDAVVEGDFV